MRKLALPMLVLGLAAVSSAWAGSGPGDAAPATDKTAAQPVASLPDAPKPAATAATPATPAVESELAELRSLLHAQAAEIEAQRRELADLKAKIGDVKEEAVEAAVIAAVPAATKAIAPNGATVLTGGGAKDESPLAIHFKGITLTPGGFTAAETVYRNRALAADVNTPLNNITNLYAPSNASKISEFNLSGRQSRFTLKFDGDLGQVRIGGYVEGDFLGAGSTSNNNESNSYVFRQRQFWGAAAFTNGWYVSGGQMWSLLTEQKVGLENRTPEGRENANVPMTIDAQYTAGFSWARQYGFRVTKSLMDKKLSLGFSLEGAATRFNATNAQQDFIVQAPGNPGGLFNPINSVSSAQAVSSNNYTLNASPDFVLKAAIDPGFGHFELVGLIRTFRDRVYPCQIPAAIGPPAACAGNPVTFLAKNDTRTGGGGAINARVPLFHKKLDIGAHALYGDGVGRYGTGSLNDVTVRPVGTLAPIHGGQGLGTIEWHATPKLDFYAYGGGEYDGRTIFAVPVSITGTGFVGYGAPTFNDSGCSAAAEATPTAGGNSGEFFTSAGSCSGSPRRLLEGTIGFWHKIWRGDKGTVQWGLQYSYVTVQGWSGTTATPFAAPQPQSQFHPTANDSMFFTSFRYYLP